MGPDFEGEMGIIKAMIRTLQIFRDNLDPKHSPLLEQSTARGHFMVLNALRLEKNYRGLGRYLGEMVGQRDVSGAALLRAAAWAARNRIVKRGER